MAMGSSAGRSDGNKTNSSAPRRATQREREGIDPPFPEERKPQYVLTARGRRVVDISMSLLAFGSFVAFCCLFAIVICAWWGLI
jgi:hypothetical protein